MPITVYGTLLDGLSINQSFTCTVTKMWLLFLNVTLNNEVSMGNSKASIRVIWD